MHAYTVAVYLLLLSMPGALMHLNLLASQNSSVACYWPYYYSLNSKTLLRSLTVGTVVSAHQVLMFEMHEALKLM